ncbi:hypothetical protein GXM_09841 [Nostoc sphaeroides CCNUC1]|uniref:Uncharacterized protein n=1 Tax=Nostoc sphaeroides CCNUC1 TaxID=2653204 RepID=A0A5P8WHK2_9NOSO|nr:hypothetical protein GXM_09841 [Nostoc sphaeroides CCNUC1]
MGGAIALPFSSKNRGAIAWFPLRTESEHNQIALVAILPNRISSKNRESDR